MSYRFPDTSAVPDLVETTLSERDGSTWVTTPIEATTYNNLNHNNILAAWELPASMVSGGSLYVTSRNRNEIKGDIVKGGKVSPLVARFALDGVPRMEMIVSG